MVEEPLRDRPALLIRVATSSSDYDWGAWAELMSACLIFPKNYLDLVDFWKSNDAMLARCEKEQPGIYTSIRDAFTSRKRQLQKEP